MTQTALKTNTIGLLLLLTTSSLTPFEEPVIFDNSTKSIVVSKGQSVQLSCHASGVPPPKIYWHRVNYILLSSGGSIHRGNLLNISNATIADRGIYYCIADNGVGDGARRHVKVEVEFSPTVTVPYIRVAQAIDHNVDLECHVEAYPPPSAITWFKDGNLLTNSVYFFSSRTNDHIVSILRVFKVDETQFGNYTCKATNSLGSDTAIVELCGKKCKLTSNQLISILDFSESEVPVCPPACQSSIEKNIEVEM